MFDMNSSKCLLAFAALALVASVKVEANLFPICRDLSAKILDPNEAFAEVKNNLSKLMDPSMKSDGERLIRAWENVMHEAKCSSDSFAEVAVLAQCSSPSVFPSLREASIKYANKCITTELVDNILLKSNSSRSNVFHIDADKFLDSEFIKKYREDSREEVDFHLSLGFYASCCSPWKAQWAIADAIRRDLKQQNKNEEKRFANKDELLSHLNEHLFIPCNFYISQVQSTMDNLLYVGYHVAGGEERLIASMKPEAKNVVFRYKFCKNVQNLISSSRLWSIVDSVFKILYGHYVYGDYGL